MYTAKLIWMISSPFTAADRDAIFSWVAWRWIAQDIFGIWRANQRTRLTLSTVLVYTNENYWHSYAWSWSNPCKIGTGISPGSHQDPGTHRYPAGILPGKNSRHVSRQESRREISTGQDPAKEKPLLQDTGENPAGKQNLDSICGENLILAKQKFFHRISGREVVHSHCWNANPSEGALNLILRFDPGSKGRSKTIVSLI